MYCPENDEINLKLKGNKYCADNTTSLTHEAAHAVTTDYEGNRLTELPAITAEMVVNKFIGKTMYGRDSDSKGIQRVCDMKSQANHIVIMNYIFLKYKSTGTLEASDLEAAGIIAEGTREEDIKHTDITKAMLYYKSCGYFMSSASALVIKDEIQSKEDMEGLFDLMNDKGLSDIERLNILGITQERMIGKINSFVHENISSYNMQRVYGSNEK